MSDDNIGWYVHNGKDMPVPADTLVLVEFADGTNDSDFKAILPFKASWWHGTGEKGNSNWIWTKEGEPEKWHIVKFRIVNQISS